MKTLLFLQLLLIATLSWSQVTSNDYQLKVLGSTVGTLHVAAQEEAGNLKRYTVDSESVIHFFGARSIVTHQEATYRDSVMLSSYCETWKNGKLEDQTSVEKTSSGYTITTNGTSHSIRQAITYSAVLLYFIVPNSVDRVFSELEGIFKSIAPTGKNTFELFDEGNHNNDYIYADGVLQKIVIDYGLFNINVLLKR